MESFDTVALTSSSYFLECSNHNFRTSSIGIGNCMGVGVLDDARRTPVEINSYSMHSFGSTRTCDVSKVKVKTATHRPKTIMHYVE